jgi:general stress protein YciG
MAPTQNDNPGNFANRSVSARFPLTTHFVITDIDDSPKDEVREIASKGGQASGGSFQPGSERASEAGQAGGKVSSTSSTSANDNPGNFANR